MHDRLLASQSWATLFQISTRGKLCISPTTEKSVSCGLAAQHRASLSISITEYGRDMPSPLHTRNFPCYRSNNDDGKWRQNKHDSSSNTATSRWVASCIRCKYIFSRNFLLPCWLAVKVDGQVALCSPPPSAPIFVVHL